MQLFLRFFDPIFLPGNRSSYYLRIVNHVMGDVIIPSVNSFPSEELSLEGTSDTILRIELWKKLPNGKDLVYKEVFVPLSKVTEGEMNVSFVTLFLGLFDN